MNPSRPGAMRNLLDRLVQGPLGNLGRVYISDSLAGSLARGATWSGGFRIGALVFGAAVQFMLARSLGDLGYGRYTYVLGWMNIAALFTMFEFPNTSVRFASLYSAAGHWDLLHGLHRLVFRFTGALSLLVAAPSAAGIWLMSADLDPELVGAGLMACAMLPLVTVLAVQSGVLLGQKRVAESQLQVSLRPGIFLLALILVVLVLGIPLDSLGALVLGWGATLLTVLVTGSMVHRASRRARQVPPRYELKNWFGMSATLLPGSFAQLTLGTTMDVVIVGTFLGSGLSGVYAVSSLLLEPAGIVFWAIGTMTSPMIADLYGLDRHDELRQLMKVVARISIGMTVPAVLLICAVGPLVLGWLGPGYDQGYSVLLILGVATIAASMGHAGNMLSMTGHHRILSVIIVSSAGLNLALAFALTPLYGLNGVASATTIAYVTRTVVLMVVATRRTGISLMPF